MCNCTPAPWLGLDGMLLAVNATAPINALRSDDGDMIKNEGFCNCFVDDIYGYWRLLGHLV